MKHDKSQLSHSESQFVIFMVADEEYCLDILKVQEIIRMVSITWLPRKPAYIIGVINLRGEIIPIVDLRTKFGLEKKEYTKFTRILIVQIAERLIGMVVDKVEEVMVFQDKQIENEPDMLSSARSSNYINGIAKIDERVIIILDIEKVLSKDDVISIADLSVPRESKGL